MRIVWYACVQFYPESFDRRSAQDSKEYCQRQHFHRHWICPNTLARFILETDDPSGQTWASKR